MLYTFSLKNFPVLAHFYSVSRNTVWTIQEKENQLIIITDGECNLSCNNKTYKMNKGDVFFVPKNCVYTRTPIDGNLCDMTYIHFLFDDECVECYNTDEIKNTIIRLKNENESDILKGNLYSFRNIICLSNHIKLDKKKQAQMFETLEDLSKHSGINKPFWHSIALCKILAILSSELIYKILTDNSIENERAIPEKLRRCINYISQNYSSNITLDALAKYNNISKQQLIRQFKSVLNTTPAQYITEFKISRAKQLLFHHNELTINEIALEMGFDNQHYFSKVFKKITGETPSDYRKRLRYYGQLEQKKKNNV